MLSAQSIHASASAPKKAILFEDEELKLPDSLARRIIFKPLPPDGSPLFTSSKQPEKVVSLNLTTEHFLPGATKFRDLKPEAFVLVSIFFNSLAFAFDKKKRLSTTPQEKKKTTQRAAQRKRAGGAVPQAAGGDGDDQQQGGGLATAVQAEEVQAEKESGYINGADHLTVFIETLMDSDMTAFRVAGYRLWVMDASNDKSGLDLLTKGVKETLLESSYIQKDVQFKLDQIASKTAAATKKAYNQKQWALNKRYNYTSITTDELFINAVGKYFAMDGLLSQQSSPSDHQRPVALAQDDDDEENLDMVEDADAGARKSAQHTHPLGGTAANNGRQQFIDSRPFLSHNRENGTTRSGDYVPRLVERINTMHTFFNKEQAMVYHVEKDNVRLQQRNLASYFGETSDEIMDGMENHKLEEKNPLRLRNLYDCVSDKAFRQFPYPATTYAIDSDFLSFDVFAEMPLPHHMGTYLYTTLDQEIATSRIEKGGVVGANSTAAKNASNNAADHNGRTKKSGGGERDLFGHRTKRAVDRVEDHVLFGTAAGEAKRATRPVLDDTIMPLGIYDTEYEINTSLMHIYPHYLTENMKKALANAGTNTNSVPRHVRDTFVSLINSDIRKGLLAIINQVDKPKPYITDASNNRDTAQENMPYLEVAAQDTSSHSLPFRATSVPYMMHNRDKRHVIDRKVFSVIGGDPNTVSKEKNKNLSLGNGAYFRSIIAQWRPVDATVDNALLCMGTSTYDKVFMERDIYLVLDVLNRYGYAQIDKHFFDPRTRKVKRGQMHQYIVTHRAFREAITVEFYDEFFTSTKVSLANIGIRNDLFGIRNGVMDTSKRHIGMRMPLSKFNIQTRPYHAYKLWEYSYFVEHDGVNHNYKTSDILFHARYHHCRSYPPHCKDPKMNVLMSGQGAAGKSHKLGAAKDACPSGVAEGITHMTNQAYNVDQNMNDMLVINEELSNKLIAPSASKNGNGTSEAANDDARNNFKERSTAGMTVSLTFYFDEETGERKARLSKCQCQNVILGATNNDLSDADPNVMSRFIIISVPRSKNDVIGNRPQDKNKLEIGKDETKNTYIQEQVREVHRIYYMVECMIKSGILGNTSFGVAIDGAQVYMTRILDLLQAKYGIATNDIRKRKHVIEMARCMCISYACWYGLTSPLTRHLQYDVYTNEFIGFNPRVLLDGIMPYLVVTKDMVINAISSLSCLWGHEYMDKILENICTSMCNLDKLRESDFVRRPRSDLEGPGSNNTATSALTTRVDPTKKKRGGRITTTVGFGGAAAAAGGDNQQEDDDMVYDYNYIAVTSKSHADIHNLLSNSLGDLCVAPNDIAKVLKDLSRVYIQTTGYEMRVVSEETHETKLCKSTNPAHCIPRRIVDYGYSAINGLPTIAVSVAFLKQKLPHALGDDIIEDLTQYSFGAIEQTEEEREAEREEMRADIEMRERTHRNNMILHDDEEDTVEMREEEKRSKKMVDKLMDAITIRPNSVNESSIIKAIRDVLENSILEYNPNESPEQEAANFVDYADIHTGRVPWFTFATGEHPPPLQIGALFPDLKEAYSKVHGHNKEIILSDKISLLQLQRKKNGIPLVYYNYNTVSSTAKASLSIFNVDDVQYPVLKEGETDKELIEEVEELEAIRAENAKFDEVTKNRFKMFADNPVFTIDRDLDYISCADHLRSIGYPMIRRENRLVNYPPHMYMDLADYRDKHKNSVPLVPLYSDVMERIATTKKIIQANLGIFAEDTPTFGSLVDANFEADDIRTSVYHSAMDVDVSGYDDVNMDVEYHQEKQEAPIVRRSFVCRENERKQARKSLLASNKRCGMDKVGEIVNNNHYMTNKRPLKRAKVGDAK